MRRGAAAAALAAAALALHCGAPATSDGKPLRPLPTVEHAGDLATILDDGEAPARAELAAALRRPHLYAVGALAGLAGEFLVWDGTAFVSRVVDGRVVVATAREGGAALYVGANVARWKDVPVPDDARDLDALAEWLPQAARAAGIDDTHPLPFLVIGAVERATLHVLSLPAGTAITPASHDAALQRIELGPAAIQGVGFRADDAADLGLPAGARVHLHLRTLLGANAGHVESLTLAKGALVKLPWR